MVDYLRWLTQNATGPVRLAEVRDVSLRALQVLYARRQKGEPGHPRGAVADRASVLRHYYTSRGEPPERVEGLVRARLEQEERGAPARRKRPV